MTAEVDYISFTLTKREIKALNKYRKEMENEDDFEFRLTPSKMHGAVAVQVRPKDREDIPWENITDYGSW